MVCSLQELSLLDVFVQVLTTFQRPLAEDTQEHSRPLKGIMKNSLSLDDLDGRTSGAQSARRSKTSRKGKMAPKSASNVSINVDSGEKVGIVYES